MAKEFKPIRVENRFGITMYVCPKCGKVFRDLKSYTRHVNKSHISKKLA